MNNIQKLMKVNSPTTLLTILSIILIALISMLFINACENTASIESPADQLSEIDIQNAVDMEEVLRTLAMALPDVMADEELSEIIYNEVNKNIEDEAYALWSEIADKPTPSGKTLRKILDTELTHSLGKVRGIAITTETFDKNKSLQVYIHNFKKWNKKDRLPVTYAPLTINDVDVKTLNVYNTDSQESILQVMPIPDYPIAIIGINEGQSFAYQFETDNLGKQSYKSTSTTSIYITKLNLDKSAWSYEPWWMGTNAEIYFYFADPIEPNNTNEWGAGYFAPLDNYVDYKVWENKWYGWTQSKPWRNINLNTQLISTRLPTNRNIQMEIIEYDPMYYDLGDQKLESLITTAVFIAFAIEHYMAGHYFQTTLAVLGAVLQTFSENDDKISKINNFQNVALQSIGVPKTYGNSDFKVEIVIK